MFFTSQKDLRTTNCYFTNVKNPSNVQLLGSSPRLMLFFHSKFGRLSNSDGVQFSGTQMSYSGGTIFCRILLCQNLDKLEIKLCFLLLYRGSSCSTEAKSTWFKNLSPVPFCKCVEENVCDSRSHTAGICGDKLHSHCQGSPGNTQTHGQTHLLVLWYVNEVQNVKWELPVQLEDC